MYIENILKIT